MPTKHVSPLLGYNNNVRHKGKVFHIQTEDSGVKYGHIITHLFMDGGRILKSVKTSYAEYLENDRMGEIVREMMKQQHKAMFIALRDGRFDPIIEGAEGASSTQSFPAATPVVSVVSSALPPLSSSSLAAAAPAVQKEAGITPVPASTSRRASTSGSAAIPAARSAAAPPQSDPENDSAATARTPSEELALDIDAVERAAAVASAVSPSLRPAHDLPPPPANLFREKVSTGRYRATPPASSAGAAARPADSGAAASSRQPSSGKMPAAAVAGATSVSGERRYAPTRPASIFGQARPQQGKSIFGDGLLSDNSLDEVILSYLAEDLEGEKK